MTIIEYIQHHPKLAFVVGAVHLASTYLISDWEVPTIVMQLFQVGAWSVTITVGMVSLYGTFKKWKQKNEPKKY